MNAISEIIEVTDQTIQYKLPEDFKARKVQLIILPVDEPASTPDKPNRIQSLRGSISGSEADDLNNHLKTVRNEW